MTSVPPEVSPGAKAEADAVRERYARRPQADPRYHPLDPAAMLARQERERLLRPWLTAALARGAGRAIEIGCGDGGGLLDLIRWGFDPAQLAGIELLEGRHALARARLPAAVTLWQGDATQLDPGAAAWDLVFVSTVFSSLLDDAFQQTLAAAMWRWLRPGGAVVWYDFAVDNPRNADVRGVPVRRLRTLFPQGRFEIRRVTLAPPLARGLCRVHPGLASLANTVPLLRTHRLAWIAKTA